MVYLHELTDGPGYLLESLAPRELIRCRELITNHYLRHLEQLQPDVVEQAHQVGIAQYHTLPCRFDHVSAWPKEARLLGCQYVEELMRMSFFERITQQLGPSATINHDELYWRIVRPDHPEDVGPVHADRWFRDDDTGAPPAGYDRFKIWMAIETEATTDCLTVKAYSQRSDHRKQRCELKSWIHESRIDESENLVQQVELPLSPGQMVLFHDALVLGGAINRGKRCRVSLELTVLFHKSDGMRHMYTLLGNRKAA